MSEGVLKSFSSKISFRGLGHLIGSQQLRRLSHKTPRNETVYRYVTVRLVRGCFWFFCVYFLYSTRCDPRIFTAIWGKEEVGTGRKRVCVLLSISFTLYCYSKCILSPHVSVVFWSVTARAIEGFASGRGLDDDVPSYLKRSNAQ